MSRFATKSSSVRPRIRVLGGRAVLGIAGIALLLAAGAPASLLAAGKQIKMATLSPENSPWDKMLKDMGKEWESGTDGRVSLRIYPGGIAGDEPDILRKMKIGQYEASALSVAGLVDIHEDFTVFEVPLFFRDFDEFEHVLGELTPTLEKRLDDNGFVLLGWGYVGWVHFFTSKRAQTVDQMRELKVWTWAGDEAMTAWWRRNDFKPVSLAATDIAMGLQTGMIEALAAPPLYVAQIQLFKQASYMADVPLAPMIGAIVVTKRAFNRLSEADQKVMRASGVTVQKKVFETIPKLDDTMVKMMGGQGLEVVEVRETPAFVEWKAAAEKFADDMRGDIVPPEIFDEAFAARQAYRAENGSE